MRLFIKKSVSLLLAALILLSSGLLAILAGTGEALFLTKAEAATEYTSGNYTYTVSGGVATITGGNCYGDVTIPSSVDGYPVRYIGDSAFLGDRNITGVTIPSSVHTIGVKAFDSCDYLKSAVIESGTTTICQRAFSNTRLEKIEIPETVTTIETQAFNGTELKELTIPSSVREIGSYAFYSLELETVYYNAADCIATGDSYAIPPFAGCESLIKIVLGKTVKKIGDYMFMDCENITGIEMHAGITSVGYNSFEGCANLSTIDFYGYDTDFNSISGSFTGALDVLRACKINYIHDEHQGILTSTTATCTAGGISSYKCCCGYSYKDEVGALGHDYESAVTSPGCTSQGYTTHTCSRCGDSYIDSYVAEKGHDYIATVTEPDCTNQGYTTYKCKRCRNTYTGDYVSENGHSYKAVVTAPTCYKKGYTTHTCSACGDSFVDSYVDAGHKYESVVTPPVSCTRQGYTTHTCSGCGTSYVDSYVDGEHDCNVYYRYTPSNSWTSEKDCENNDQIMYSCKNCSYRKYEHIEPTEHTLELPKGFDPDVEYPYGACVWNGAECTVCNATVYRYQDNYNTIHQPCEEWKESGNGRIYKTCDWCNCETDEKQIYIELDESVLSEDGYWHITNGSDVTLSNINYKITLVHTVENFEGSSESYTCVHDITDEYRDFVSIGLFGIDGNEYIYGYTINYPYGGIAAFVIADFEYYPNGRPEFAGSSGQSFTISSQKISIYVDRRTFSTKWSTYHGTYETPFVEGTYDYLSPDYYLYDDPAYEEYGYQWAADWNGLPVPAAPKGYTFEKWDFTCFPSEAPSYNMKTTAIYTPIAPQIKNNPHSRTINYGETLRLSTDFEPLFGEQICWYVDGVKKGEGKTFDVYLEKGSVEVEMKLVDWNGKVCTDSYSSQTVSVNSGFFQKLISFFKNLFGSDRLIIQ